MLVGEDNLVEVGGDLHFVVGEIPQPGAAAGDGIGQQRKDLGQGEPDALAALVGLGQWRQGTLGTVVDPQLTSCHSSLPYVADVVILTPGLGGQRPTLPAVLSHAAATACLLSAERVVTV